MTVGLSTAGRILFSLVSAGWPASRRASEGSEVILSVPGEERPGLEVFSVEQTLLEQFIDEVNRFLRLAYSTSCFPTPQLTFSVCSQRR
jgi:hypothetical protein